MPYWWRGVLAALACGLLLAAGLARAQQPLPAPNPEAAAHAPAGKLPLRRDEPGTVAAGPWVTGTALLACIAVAGALVAVRRGRWTLLAPAGTQAEPARRIERLASQPLTAQASVHAIRWNGEELLVGCNAQQVTLLARRPAPSEDA